ncbi:hypothetical protein NDU88_001938 [Pleurodeles waltl]|uniref:Uncharacterized protein n=1 Tax=Pleurodeles waltl TaxID=8319 RepID=A0AAV7P9E1_PLEWA|nr:hypothetical protein NDU88_001938 [Pleurodeles waltl]
MVRPDAQSWAPDIAAGKNANRSQKKGMRPGIRTKASTAARTGSPARAAEAHCMTKHSRDKLMRLLWM